MTTAPASPPAESDEQYLNEDDRLLAAEIAEHQAAVDRLHRYPLALRTYATYKRTGVMPSPPGQRPQLRARSSRGPAPTRHSGSRRGSRSPPSSDDDPPGDAEPPPGRRPRHISEVTRALLRGWLDRFNRTAADYGLEPHERLELYLSLPADEQADHFAQLAESERQERILDGDLEEPRPQRPRKAPRRSPRGDSPRRSVEADVFEQLAPPEYWEALTGDHVPVDGLVRCPTPGHEDVHPSCIVYPDPGAGWWCPVCDTGGSAIDLAEAITGIRARGRGYLQLREWVAGRLLNQPIRRTA